MNKARLLNHLTYDYGKREGMIIKHVEIEYTQKTKEMSNFHSLKYLTKLDLIQIQIAVIIIGLNIFIFFRNALFIRTSFTTFSTVSGFFFVQISHENHEG